MADTWVASAMIRPIPARWRLVDTVTKAVTSVALDTLVVDGMQRHFGGAWAKQVPTPPNPVKSGVDRGYIDGAKISLGASLRVEVAEVKSRATGLAGGCALASREAQGYVGVLRAIGPTVAAISRVVAPPGVRVSGARCLCRSRSRSSSSSRQSVLLQPYDTPPAPLT